MSGPGLAGSTVIPVMASFGAGAGSPSCAKTGPANEATRTRQSAAAKAVMRLMRSVIYHPETMKDRPDAILKSEQAAYLDRLLPPRGELLAELEREAAAESVPISDPEVGKLLALLARAAGARRMLEVGTAIGYGTLWLAQAVPEAHIVSIDRSPQRLARAREALTRAGVADRVELVEGEALEILPGLEGPFDLVYLDGDKATYRRCLDLGLQKLRVGGLVVIDNVLWKGHVADPPADASDEDEAAADAMATFNSYLMIHPQLEALVLPLGDGVGLAVKKKPLVTDLGGPF